MAEKQLNNIGQQMAINHGPGPLLVTAGPGSGKTYTITQRIRWLIEEQGVDPDSILVITFTKAAAGEMKQRFARLTEGKNYPVSFGTFHAIYYHILRTAYHYRSGNILSDIQKREIIKTISVQIRNSCPDDDEIDALLSEISKYKNDDVILRHDSVTSGRNAAFVLNQIEFEKIFNAYTEELNRSGKLDFDDIVLKCRELFQKYPAILEAWQRKFLYILVDEFQDINFMQYEVLKMLALPENNLFVVGDDDQSIYAFRGAKPEIMRDFLKDYPSAGRVELSVNYRSTPEIVNAAGKLIRANKNRLEKKTAALKEYGQSVNYQGFQTRREENQMLAEEAEKDIKEGKSVAVIFRTNQEAGELAALLMEKEVSFTMKEKLKSPYRSPVIKDLLAYLSFAGEGQKRKDFYRIMNKPSRYIGRTALSGEIVKWEDLERFYRDHPYMHSILRKLKMDTVRIKKMDLYAAVNYIRKGMGYDEWIVKERIKDGLAQADWFQNQMRSFASLQELKQHIADFEFALENAEEKTVPDGIQLMTMHASKGLEFDSVYIPYCNEGIIPHKKSMKDSQIEEERRMLYVAMTRAKEKLTIMWVSGTQEEPGFLSRFLSDLGISDIRKGK